MKLDRNECRHRITRADHGVLATVGSDGLPHAVPVCFAVDAAVGRLVVPVDRVKAKSTTRLRRQENLAAHPSASLLVERWDSGDWSHLWWVRADLRLEVDSEPTRSADLEKALRVKYPQYVAPDTVAEVSVFTIQRLTGWSAS